MLTKLVTNLQINFNANLNELLILLNFSILIFTNE